MTALAATGRHHRYDNRDCGLAGGDPAPGAGAPGHGQRCRARAPDQRADARDPRKEDLLVPIENGRAPADAVPGADLIGLRAWATTCRTPSRRRSWPRSSPISRAPRERSRWK